MPPQADDNEEQHVLIVGETEENVNRAKYLIEKVIYSDDNTRNKIKEEQLKASKEMRTELFLSMFIFAISYKSWNIFAILKKQKLKYKALLILLENLFLKK